MSMENQNKWTPEQLKVALSRETPCKHFHLKEKKPFCFFTESPEELPADINKCFVECQKYEGIKISPNELALHRLLALLK
jgi:hypothetical protein